MFRSMKTVRRSQKRAAMLLGLAAFAGLISIAIGGVLVLVVWWDRRRGLPPELTGQ